MSFWEKSQESCAGIIFWPPMLDKKPVMAYNGRTKISDLYELRNPPDKNRSFMFSERPESCEKPHYFRMEQLQNRVGSNCLDSRQ